MRETPEVKNANSEGLPPSDNAAVSEAVWQKWLNKNKERDAARRKKLIRLFWFILALVFVGTVVRWPTVSKGSGGVPAELVKNKAQHCHGKLQTQRLKSEAELERAYLLNLRHL